MELTVYFVDAFTQSQFKGNSAAVIVTQNWLDEPLMQQLATEHNLSETAFVVERDGVHHIRWFSPMAEVPFCGHATLASAFVLFHKRKDVDVLTFSAKAVGDFTVERQGDRIEMDFPNRKPELIEDIPEALLKGLSIPPRSVLRNQQAYFAVYDSAEQVMAVCQDKEWIKQLAPYDTVVTAAVNPEIDQLPDYHIASRYFWPANGGDEDPVTGSIHAGLAPYWAEQLGINHLVAYQASTRGGVLYCDVQDDRIKVAGYGVLYMKGTIYLQC